MPVEVGEGADNGVDYTYTLVKSASSATYDWQLKDLFSLTAPTVSTDVFVLGGWKWKLYIKPRSVCGDRLVMSAWFKSCNDTTTPEVECSFAAVHRTSSKKTIVKQVIPKRCAPDEKVECQCLIEKVDEDSIPKCFLSENGDFTLRAKIEILKQQIGNFTPKTSPDTSKTIDVELLTDDVLTNNILENACIGFAGSAQFQHPDYSLSASELLTDFCDKVAKDFECDMSKGRLWLLSPSSDGLLEVNECLSVANALPYRLGDFVTSKKVSSSSKQLWWNRPKVAAKGSASFHLKLYLDQSASVPVDAGTVVFCSSFDQHTKTLSYCDKVCLPANATTAELFESVKSVKSIPKGTPFSLYIRDGKKLNVREVDALQSIAENGIYSGSVVILRLRKDDEKTTDEKIVRELESLIRPNAQFSNFDPPSEPSSGRRSSTAEEDLDDRRSRLPRLKLDESQLPAAKPSFSQTTTVQPSSKSSERDDLRGEPLCLVCMEKPRTAGFKHGTTTHMCVCDKCARSLSKVSGTRCPACKLPVEKTVYESSSQSPRQ